MQVKSTGQRFYVKLIRSSPIDRLCLYGKGEVQEITGDALSFLEKSQKLCLHLHMISKLKDLPMYPILHILHFKILFSGHPNPNTTSLSTNSFLISCAQI